jgi:Kyakuja-Dileera-Zisupton transposase
VLPLNSSKYALATVEKLLNTFGADQGGGYDISWAFRSTIASSSIHEKVEIQRFILVVNAFHGHTHNQLCQLQHHPLYLPGFGLEDLEMCK